MSTVSLDDLRTFAEKHRYSLEDDGNMGFALIYKEVEELDVPEKIREHLRRIIEPKW